MNNHQKSHFFSHCSARDWTWASHTPGKQSATELHPQSYASYFKMSSNIIGRVLIRVRDFLFSFRIRIFRFLNWLCRELKKPPESYSSSTFSLIFLTGLSLDLSISFKSTFFSNQVLQVPSCSCVLLLCFVLGNLQAGF